MKKASKRGRPPLPPDRVKGERIEFRADVSEKLAYENAAKVVRLELSEWIRLRLNHAAKRDMAGS